MSRRPNSLVQEQTSNTHTQKPSDYDSWYNCPPQVAADAIREGLAEALTEASSRREPILAVKNADDQGRVLSYEAKW